eukprot:1494261-Prymnesium_polylepis.1
MSRRGRSRLGRVHVFGIVGYGRRGRRCRGCKGRRGHRGEEGISHRFDVVVSGNGWLDVRRSGSTVAHAPP